MADQCEAEASELAGHYGIDLTQGWGGSNLIRQVAAQVTNP
jgi:hypothetical protein